MIARLRGRLADKEPGRLVLDVNGVGYEVHVPLSTFCEVGEPGANVSLRIHTHVREDTLALFGFASRLERELFERLIGVNGVGPKLALAVLSGIDPHDLVQAIRRGEHARLHSVPGVGRKTAERIGLELKDKLPAPGPDEAAEPRRGERVRTFAATCCRRSSTWATSARSPSAPPRRPCAPAPTASRRPCGSRCASWPGELESAARLKAGRTVFRWRTCGGNCCGMSRSGERTPRARLAGFWLAADAFL